jgi:hypothetical protein
VTNYSVGFVFSYRARTCVRATESTSAVKSDIVVFAVCAGSRATIYSRCRDQNASFILMLLPSSSSPPFMPRRFA